MAKIELTIPDAVLPRVIDALCAEGRKEEDDPTPRPQYARLVLIDWVRGVVYKHEALKAAEAARVAADARARSEVTIT